MEEQQSLKPMIAQYHLSIILPERKIPVSNACRGDSEWVLTGENLNIAKYPQSTRIRI
jgi:hypothetical protein